MIESIIAAIAAELKRVYPEVAKRYVVPVECGFEAPAFYIHAVQPSFKPHLFRQAVTSTLIEVVYFADASKPKEMVFDLFKKAEELPQVLRYIPCGGRELVGVIGETVWQDDTLHVMATYRGQTQAEDGKPKMAKSTVTVQEG